MSKSQTSQPTAESLEPRSVEMPRPTAWPIVIALGITLVMLGAATEPTFSIVGIVLFVVSLVGWISNLLPGRGHGHEPISSQPREVAELQRRPRTGAVQQLKPGVVGYRFQLPEKVHPVSAGLRGGIVGGLLMPIPALIWALMNGHTIWFPVNLLAGLVLPTLDQGTTEEIRQQLEAFHPWMLLGGIVLHVAMSIGFGLIGGVLLPTLPRIPGGPLLFGGLILPLLWTGVSYELMGLVNPVLNQFIDWKWYVVSQLVYGIATSIVIMLSEQIPIAPRGRGEDGGAPSVPTGLIGCIALLCVLLSGCGQGGDNLPGKPNPADAFIMPQEVKDFGELYAQRCAGCHGANGNVCPGPPLNDPLFVSLVSEEELTDVISKGRHGTLMPAWSQSAGGPLTDAQVAVLVQGIKKPNWKRVNEATSQSVHPNAPQLMLAANARGGIVESGAKVFATACAGCHGERGEGTKSGGAINDPAFLALMSDTILRRYVITGRPDLEMPNFAESSGRDKDFAPLTSEQVSDVVALLGSWRHPSTSE